MSTVASLALLVGFLLRCLVPQLLPRLTSVLDKFVLLATPVNSYRSLNEGLFLLKTGMDPYTSQGQILHHPPLVLYLTGLIKTSPVADNVEINVFYALVDILFAVQLIKLNARMGNKFKAYQIALFYAFNPLAIVATLAKSTYLLNNLVIISALNAAHAKRFSLAMVLIGISTYLGYYSWYFVIPLSFYIGQESIPDAFKALLTYAVAVCSLLVASFRLTGSWAFLDLCYGSLIRFEKITPNVGLWWYFFTEIFEFFSNFYIGLFNIYTFIFTIPLTIRFVDGNIDNLVFTIWSIMAFTTFGKGYPCLADYAIVYTIPILFQPLFKYLKFSMLVMYVALLVVMFLSPIFYFVWMAFNSGNANFFYAIGLSLNLVQMIILTDFIWGKIKAEYVANGGDGTAKLTQI